jgi:hypothetical protein
MTDQTTPKPGDKPPEFRYQRPTNAQIARAARQWARKDFRPPDYRVSPAKADDE